MVSCGLCSPISLASRNLRSEPREVEKGPSTQPINAASFFEVGDLAPRLVPFFIFLAADLIFQSPQNSEKNRQTVNKERLFY